MEKKENNVEGVIKEVSLERDGERFGSFNIKIGMIMNTERTLTYEQGEKIMKQMSKRLLGKKVEISSIIILCPICGKGFNTEKGMKQHKRIVHSKNMSETTNKQCTKMKESKVRGSGRRKKSSKK